MNNQKSRRKWPWKSPWFFIGVIWIAIFWTTPASCTNRLQKKEARTKNLMISVKQIVYLRFRFKSISLCWLKVTCYRCIRHFNKAFLHFQRFCGDDCRVKKEFRQKMLSFRSSCFAIVSFSHFHRTVSFGFHRFTHGTAKTSNSNQDRVPDATVDFGPLSPRLLYFKRDRGFEVRKESVDSQCVFHFLSVVLMLFIFLSVFQLRKFVEVGFWSIFFQTIIRLLFVASMQNGVNINFFLLSRQVLREVRLPFVFSRSHLSFSPFSIESLQWWMGLSVFDLSSLTAFQCCPPNHCCLLLAWALLVRSRLQPPWTGSSKMDLDNSVDSSSLPSLALVVILILCVIGLLLVLRWMLQRFWKHAVLWFLDCFCPLPPLRIWVCVCASLYGLSLLFLSFSICLSLMAVSDSSSSFSWIFLNSIIWF